MEIFLIVAAAASLALGGAMTWVAWRIISENRGRESARVQLLSNLAFPDGPPPPEPSWDEFVSEDAAPSAATSAAPALFDEPVRSAPGSRRAVALAAVGVVMLAAVSTYAWFHGDSAAAPEARSAPAAASPSAAHAAHVDLLALDHRLTRRFEFVVNGRVRNPAGGESLRDLIAVVEVFDRSDRVIATVSAPVESSVLRAGESASFSVEASQVPGIARYRIEFRVNGRDAVPHVDLRGKV
jgi:hypothetical protein